MYRAIASSWESSLNLNGIPTFGICDSQPGKVHTAFKKFPESKSHTKNRSNKIHEWKEKKPLWSRGKLPFSGGSGRADLSPTRYEGIAINTKEIIKSYKIPLLSLPCKINKGTNAHKQSHSSK